MAFDALAYYRPKSYGYSIADEFGHTSDDDGLV